jgi:hypothetical protein
MCAKESMGLLQKCFNEFKVKLEMLDGKHPWFSQLSGKLPKATLNIQGWRLNYSSWCETQNIDPFASQEMRRSQEFCELKQTFITLFSLLFAYENFQPVLGA